MSFNLCPSVVKNNFRFPLSAFSMLKSSISPAAVQTLFDSASNAEQKGQAAWFTPVEWARLLSIPLNDYRPVIADLTCGNGSLLRGAKNQTEAALLGCDIAPEFNSKFTVAADLTRLYAKLRAVDWKSDCFVLNPPWDLHWYRGEDSSSSSSSSSSLYLLAQSECPAVRDAFAAHDGRTPRECIDSTIATLGIALDRSSHHADILLIANNATLDRLIFGDKSPHRALAAHVWARLAIEGNLCADQRDAGPNYSKGDFMTGIVWLARGHDRGPQFTRTLRRDEFGVGKAFDADRLREGVRTICEHLKRERYTLRDGSEAARYMKSDDIAELWLAAKEEHERELGLSKLPPFNIWYDHQAAVIRTHLNTFDTASGRVDKAAAAALHALNGRQPMQLVVLRSQRKALLDAVKPESPWRVDPALTRAVESAIVEYNRVRAPLYPLPKIQRLGYLDEQDDIECCRPLPGFRKGRRYVLRSTTVAVKRLGTKMNTIGLLDDVEWNGQELAFFVTDDDGIERCFMEGRNREPNVTVNLIKPGTTGRKDKYLESEPCVIDFTLNELADSFVIPEVPDVATLNPRQYEANLRTLEAIVRLVIGFKFKQFQMEDYARGALHDGIILGHDTGLGKTIAMFIWPLLKVGYLTECVPHGPKLRPAKPVLLVVPGDGHDQTDDEYRRHFGHSGGPTGTVRLDSQATFYRLAKPDPRTGRFTLPPHYYLTSYTQLTGNGVAEFPPLSRLQPERTMSQLNLKEQDAVDWWTNRGEIYQEHYERLRALPESSWQEIESHFKRIQRESDKVVVDLARESLEVLRQITPLGGPGAGRKEVGSSRCDDRTAQRAVPTTKRFNAAVQLNTDHLKLETGWEALTEQQQSFIRSELVIGKHREFSAGIGLTHNEAKSRSGVKNPNDKIKCVYSPSLADLCQDCFSVCVIDEGTKIKGDDTIIGTGVRQVNADYRLVLTATPIKNRFPDLFHLAHYVCGGHEEPTPRFPYAKLDKQQFAEEFLVSERNLTKEENSEEKRRYVKFTPQVCNVHRAWKLLAPVILRRRKEDCGEEIVPKIRHVVRVPMGLYQAAAYQFHLKAKYQDVNGRPAIGAKLQALRIAAANPASELLQRPEHDVTEGNPRSQYTYVPKVASALELVRQAMERREQVIIGSAFQNGLDVFSARLKEAGVPHLVLDGRVSQKRRGELARQFKAGPPKAVDLSLVTRHSEFPVLLAGQECMAELHSFNLCNNVLLTAYSWAFDKFEQFINRAHRLNSPWPVNVWSVICDGSIDRKLEGGIHEKKDAAELVLDGHLLGEHPAEVNLAELLHLAQREFKHVKTLDEHELEQGWPRLRSALSRAFVAWREAKAVPQIVNRKSEIGNDLPLWRQRFLRRNGN
ncbi:MAG: DEAD/DEAH box helicase [Patescibacteria group bacterium]|nr:DEAD/DEAH box helicase [Patescibacteria group bacterium]